MEHVVVNNRPNMTSARQSNCDHSGGAPGPGDSDGEDSDDKGGNGPSRRPQVPQLPHQNPFENPSGEISTATTKTVAEPQFDMKLKTDTIPTWDGNPDSLR